LSKVVAVKDSDIEITPAGGWVETSTTIYESSNTKVSGDYVIVRVMTTFTDPIPPLTETLTLLPTPNKLRVIHAGSLVNPLREGDSVTGTIDPGNKIEVKVGLTNKLKVADL